MTSTWERQARMVAAPMTLLIPGAGPPPTMMASFDLSDMWCTVYQTVMSPWTVRSDGPVRLQVGTMNFGKRTPREESERIVRRAIERGLAFFDTANAYNDGESERILGAA